MTSVSSLRQLTPRRALSMTEALRLAELQANRLLEQFAIADPPTPVSVVSELPKVRIEELAKIPVSGSAHWSGQDWIIVVRSDEPLVRKRFSMAHELKHIVDHPFRDYLYSQPKRTTAGRDRAEVVADHFAACLLMPKKWIYAAWNEGIRDVGDLAYFFEVSRVAMERRIRDLGLAPITAPQEVAA